MTGPAAPVVPLALARPRVNRRYLGSLRDIRAGRIDPLTEAINDASDTDPVLREMLDSKQSGIVYVASLKRFVVIAVGKGTKVHIATAATREEAEELLRTAPGRTV